VRLDVREAADELVVRLEHPGPGRRAFEPKPKQGIGAAPADLAAELLEQGPSAGMAHHKHLPARLHSDAPLDKQSGQLFDPWVTHSRRSLRKKKLT
jgi:hypothetical protein